MFLPFGNERKHPAIRHDLIVVTVQDVLHELAEPSSILDFIEIERLRLLQFRDLGKDTVLDNLGIRDFRIEIV